MTSPASTEAGDETENSSVSVGESPTPERLPNSRQQHIREWAMVIGTVMAGFAAMLAWQQSVEANHLAQNASRREVSYEAQKEAQERATEETRQADMIETWALDGKWYISNRSPEVAYAVKASVPMMGSKHLLLSGPSVEDVVVHLEYGSIPPCTVIAFDAREYSRYAKSQQENVDPTEDYEMALNGEIDFTDSAGHRWHKKSTITAPITEDSGKIRRIDPTISATIYIGGTFRYGFAYTKSATACNG